MVIRCVVPGSCHSASASPQGALCPPADHFIMAVGSTNQIPQFVLKAPALAWGLSEPEAAAHLKG